MPSSICWNACICLIEDRTIDENTPSIRPDTNLGKSTDFTRSENTPPTWLVAPALKSWPAVGPRSLSRLRRSSLGANVSFFCSSCATASWARRPGGSSMPAYGSAR